MIEKKLDDRDRIVYSLTLSPERILNELKMVAFEVILEFFVQLYPEAEPYVIGFIVAILRTKIQGGSSSAFFKNLQEELSPEQFALLQPFLKWALID